jgi:tetratricopeptide (TPR) repeat protein/predicted RNA-binding Zn-ribbon protein involved in translation (DUF1610 family)
MSVRSLFRKSEGGAYGKNAIDKWTADFSKREHSHFDIKSESSYDANIRKSGSCFCLSLGLKKTGCIAWTKAPECYYSDQIINAKIRIETFENYAAAGIMFRMADENTYYSFLISNKDYFRLDVFRNGTPMPLIAWTELPNNAASKIMSEQGVDFTIIAYGSHIVILIRNQWAAEINDSSLLEGSIAFSAASYETNENADDGRDPFLFYSSLPEKKSSYTVETFLESLTIDPRISEAAALYENWNSSAGIDPGCRFRLAETFTAMNQHKAALAQIRKAWEVPGCSREQKQLLLAGRLAQSLGLVSDAEQYISLCIGEDVDSPEGKAALAEMTKILYALERYAELKDYCNEALKLLPDDPIINAFQGHAFWNLKEYEASAASYDRAFELDKENGLHAKNAANVYEVLGKKKEALERYIEGGRAFLAADNRDDLGLLVPKLLALGEDNYYAHGLAGKWAFGIEDWGMAAKEFKKAESLRKKKKGTPKDAALCYLEALLLIQKGKRSNAVPLLEEAVKLEKDYALFRFKLAETRYLLKDDPNDPVLCSELETALALAPADGWLNNLAAQICFARGDLESAKTYLGKAAAVLGETPAVKANMAELLFSQGKADEAVKLLSVEKEEDPEGVMANCAGNFLFRSERFEEADAKYRKAVQSAPGNTGFMMNHASCLLELGLYGEADTILSKIHDIAPSPDVLELISYAASKKGEYERAETACRAALKMEPSHAPSLLSLGWILAARSKFNEGEEALRLLDELELGKKEKSRLKELCNHYDKLLYTKIKCSYCARKWKVPKEPPPVQSMRLQAMPPDDLPAGECPNCGKALCIGCAKKHLDAEDRFTCPDCRTPLKLINEGLKKLVFDWADGTTKEKT